jgi:UDP-3-O-[3-hydroxymyristoyl] glucosamine N-acyltransferase
MNAALSFPRPVLRPCTVETLLAEASTAAIYARGDLTTWIRSVAAPEHASMGSFTFVQSDPNRMRATDGSVIVATEDLFAPNSPPGSDRCWIAVADPRRWFSQALLSLFPAPEAHINETAIIAPTAQIGAGVSIGPYCVIGEHTTIGDNTRLGSHVTVHEGCRIGDNCVVQDHTTIGVSGVAYYREVDGSWYGLPHLGIVAIGNGVEIGAHCAIVRGILYDTLIEDGAKLGHFINIGHNTIVGENCWITAGAVICGRVAIGRDVQIAAGAVIRDKITIGERARIGLGAVVTKNVRPGDSLFGVPGRTLRTMGDIA